MKRKESNLPSDPEQLARLARAADTSSDTLDDLARIDLPFIREDVARHPNVRPETLARMMPATLSTNVGFRDARAIAAAGGAPSAVLERIVRLIPPGRLGGARRECSPYVALLHKLASHPSCPPQPIIEILAGEQVARRLKVDIAKSTPHVDLLRALVSDKSTAVRDAAQRSLQRLDRSRPSG
jgi:hypothetical protein